MTVDAWDPYRTRQYVGHLIDKRHFDAMLGCDKNGKALHSIDSLGGGILDAPEEIPYGSTLRISTIGGWEREEYNRCPRWALDMSWQKRQNNSAGMAEVLKKILEDTA
jgi:hypothetical protein